MYGIDVEHLEWEDDHPCYIAYGVGIAYVITASDSGRFGLRINDQKKGHEVSWFDNLEAAKKAANDDFADRISRVVVGHTPSASLERSLRGLQGKLDEIRQQNEVNIEYARRDHPADNPLTPQFEILAHHIGDRLDKADSILGKALASFNRSEDDDVGPASPAP